MVLVNEMERGAGDVVSLLVGGEDGAVIAKPNIREAEPVGQNTG